MIEEKSTALLLWIFFIELTVSSSLVQRAVMDAAMNLLGGGLCVRVLMQGKKVPDEAATLSQMGISHIAKAESLSFMLEPSPVLMSPSGTSEDPLLVLSRVANHPSPRYAFHCHLEPLFMMLSDTL